MHLLIAGLQLRLHLLLLRLLPGAHDACSSLLQPYASCHHPLLVAAGLALATT
jgi:hypothetical protein